MAGLITARDVKNHDEMRCCSATKRGGKRGEVEVSNFAHTPQSGVNGCMSGLIDCARQTTDDDMRQFPQQAGLVQGNVKTMFRGAKHLEGSIATK